MLLGIVASISFDKIDSKLSLSPQTDGQTERVNQILEDMLRACVIHYDKSWDKCLALAEFSYNNSYQESLKMAPFEALYGRRCRTPLSWSQVGERGNRGRREGEGNTREFKGRPV